MNFDFTPPTPPDIVSPGSLPRYRKRGPLRKPKVQTRSYPEEELRPELEDFLQQDFSSPQAQRAPPVDPSLKLSGKQIINDVFATVVESVLEEYHIPRHSPVFNIKKNRLLRKVDNSRQGLIWAFDRDEEAIDFNLNELLRTDGMFQSLRQEMNEKLAQLNALKGEVKELHSELKRIKPAGTAWSPQASEVQDQSQGLNRTFVIQDVAQDIANRTINIQVGAQDLANQTFEVQNAAQDLANLTLEIADESQANNISSFYSLSTDSSSSSSSSSGSRSATYDADRSTSYSGSSGSGTSGSSSSSSSDDGAPRDNQGRRVWGFPDRSSASSNSRSSGSASSDDGIPRDDQGRRVWGGFQGFDDSFNTSGYATSSFNQSRSLTPEQPDNEQPADVYIPDGLEFSDESGYQTPTGSGSSASSNSRSSRSSASSNSRSSGSSASSNSRSSGSSSSDDGIPRDNQGRRVWGFPDRSSASGSSSSDEGIPRDDQGRRVWGGFQGFDDSFDTSGYATSSFNQSRSLTPEQPDNEQPGDWYIPEGLEFSDESGYRTPTGSGSEDESYRSPNAAQAPANISYEIPDAAQAPANISYEIPEVAPGPANVSHWIPGAAQALANATMVVEEEPDHYDTDIFDPYDDRTYDVLPQLADTSDVEYQETGRGWTGLSGISSLRNSVQNINNQTFEVQQGARELANQTFQVQGAAQALANQTFQVQGAAQALANQTFQVQGAAQALANATMVVEEEPDHYDTDILDPYDDRTYGVLPKLSDTSDVEYQETGRGWTGLSNIGGSNVAIDVEVVEDPHLSPSREHVSYDVGINFSTPRSPKDKNRKNKR